MSTRYYTRDMVGDRCPVCHLRIPMRLLEAGIDVHPTCAPELEASS